MRSNKLSRTTKPKTLGLVFFPSQIVVTVLHVTSLPFKSHFPGAPLAEKLLEEAPQAHVLNLAILEWCGYESFWPPRGSQCLFLSPRGHMVGIIRSVSMDGPTAGRPMLRVEVIVSSQLWVLKILSAA